LIYGDEFSKNFYDSNATIPLLNEVFQSVALLDNGIATRKDNFPKELSIKSELKKLKDITRLPEMDEKSVLLLNYGLPYLDRLSFNSYRKMTDIVARTLDRYKGQVVWRTTSSLKKPSSDVFKSFETFQRTKLFNAYILSKMCAEGYPAVDVFDMTQAIPNQTGDAAGFEYSIVKPISRVLKHYFETRSIKRCAREKVFKKVKVADLLSETESESGSGSGNEETSSRDQAMQKNQTS